MRLNTIPQTQTPEQSCLSCSTSCRDDQSHKYSITQLSSNSMEDDKRMDVHPALTMVLQDEFLCCLLLTWTTSKFFPTVSVLPRPYRSYM